MQMTWYYLVQAAASRRQFGRTMPPGVTHCRSPSDNTQLTLAVHKLNWHSFQTYCGLSWVP